ncbi:hypothetical protein VYF65_003465 [Lysinibacillus irui]|uniref:hypothetical protein n=1 Tax=Lysinibacillus irui TaxID=2998077 RepID=UPI0038894DF6
MPEYIEPVPVNVVTEQKVSRRIYYKNQFVEIPDFLRNAFLLPRRFPKSTTFLIRLNGEQETNDECFFEELRLFV